MEIGSSNISSAFKYNAQFDYQKIQGQLNQNGQNIQVSAETLSLQIQFEALDIGQNNFSAQSGLSFFDEDRAREILEQVNSELIGYTGSPLNELSSEEAGALVAEDGFFGIEQTASRVADFVIQGAGDDVQKLQAGREGILQGFKEAEEIFGGELFEISYKTLEEALARVDERLVELGAPVLNIEA